MSLLSSTPFRHLAGSRRILLAGAGGGGGFDIFCAVPIAIALRNAGKEVWLANLTFTYIGGTNAHRLDPITSEVTPKTVGEDRYFPERALSRWLDHRGEPSTVYAFEKTGVRPLRGAYLRLVQTLDLDAIVLVDGGTDILMRGDEAGLGTPCEDMTSLAAVSALADVETRVVVCLGFGIDAYHGVCHAQFLENVSALAKDGGYLGAVSLLPADAEGSAYLDLVDYAHNQMPSRASIVNASIASALRGEFGDHHTTERTRESGSKLFINPLMSLYWAFDLPAVARRSLYLDRLECTETIWDVQLEIEAFRHTAQTRARSAIPV